MQKRLKKYNVIFICLILFIGIIGSVSLMKERYVKEDKAVEINPEDIKAIFLSMYNNVEFYQSDANVQIEDTLFLGHPKVENIEEFISEIERMKEIYQKMNTVYFIVSPLALWNVELSQNNMEIQGMATKLCNFLKDNADITFELILPFQDINYWNSYTQTEIEAELQSSEKLAMICSSYANVNVHYVGDKGWLIGKGTDQEGDMVNETFDNIKKLLDKVDGNKYVVTTDVIQTENQLILDEINRSSNQLNEKMREWDIVFWGDSIIGLDHTNTSVPNVVSRLTGASTYNMGIGGASLASGNDMWCGFNEMIDLLLKKKMVDNFVNCKEFISEVQRFNEQHDKNLCFVINFGINDYINGAMIDDKENQYNVESYMGALRVAIEKLQEEFPNAEFIVMTPTYINSYLEGEEQNAISGCILQEYREAVKVIAEEYDIYCKDNYEDLSIDGSNYWKYYLDDIHLNGNGRFIFAESFIDYFEANILR